MQYNNNLNTSLNALNAGEAAALADINRRTTLANDSYNSGLASANAKIEADYINNLLNQREKELNRQLQEKQFNESVRQFNENMKFQREQLQSRFSSGSGGGGRSYKGSSNIGTEVYGSNPTGGNPSGYDAIKPGQVYAVSVPVENKSKTATKKSTTKKSTKKSTKKTTTSKKTTTVNKNNPFKSIQGTFNK